MTIRWSPNSCQCILDIESDSSGNVTLTAMRTVCAVHQNIADNEILGIILQHNRQFDTNDEALEEFKRTRLMGEPQKRLR